MLYKIKIITWMFSPALVIPILSRVNSFETSIGLDVPGSNLTMGLCTYNSDMTWESQSFIIPIIQYNLVSIRFCLEKPVVILFLPPKMLFTVCDTNDDDDWLEWCNHHYHQSQVKLW